MRPATVRMRSSLQRISRTYDEINAYLFALAFGLVVLDGTVFAATRVLPLETSILDSSSETSPSAVGDLTNADSPIALDACSRPFPCVAD